VHLYFESIDGNGRIGRAIAEKALSQSLNRPVMLSLSKAVLKMLAQGADGFEGGMTARKYMGITRASKATATRDLQQLHEMGAFTWEGGGRSVRCHLNFDL
jgi:Fic family protein